MPIPFLFIGIAAVTGVTGMGATVKAGVDHSKAKSLNENSNRRMENAALRLDGKRVLCGKALQELGEIKTFVLANSVRSFLYSFTQIKNVDFSNSVGLEETDKLRIDQKDFEELSHLSMFSTSLVEGGITGTIGGALTAMGAFSAAGSLATASTGTAIATLSGAAAQNATLAFFGGGSLATGGLGMAGGTAVLGGLVAGPALLVMGIITGAKAGKALEDAKANASKTNEICKEFELGTDVCIAIRRRSYMFYNLIARLDTYMVPLIDKMNEIIQNEGIDYSKYTIDSKKTIAAAASIAVTIKSVLDTPILTETGELTKCSEEMAIQTIHKIDTME